MITLIYNNKTYTLKIDTNNDTKINLAQFIFLSGHLPPRPLCAGIGHCGRCKVIFHSPAPQLTPTEEKVLSPEEQKNNIRLACKHNVQDKIIIEVSQDSYEKNSALNIKLINPLSRNIDCRLFIDIGTTSIAWQCQALEKYKGSNKDQFSNEEFEHIIQTGQALNPQMIAGADIIARLYTANKIQSEEKEEEQKQGRTQENAREEEQKNHKNKSLLKDLIYNHIKKIISELADNKLHVQEIFIAANPSIMALSLGTDISKLCSAPYKLLDSGNRYATLYDLPPIWLPPQMSPFIGADACAGLAYILSQKKINTLQQTKKSAILPMQLNITIKQENESFLLADMGTNAEFIFYDGKNTLLGASVPLGPAIEGVGMRCGGPVHGKGENTILSFHLGIKGLEYICAGTPKFICGAAYLSLIHILLSINLLDRQGFFQETASPLASKIAKRIHLENEEKRLYLTDDLYICSEDIENILKVKSAFFTALQLLTKSQNPKTLYLSGALSEYIPLNHMENLGFIPQGSSKSTKLLGNSSLKGLIQLSYSKILCDEVAKKIQNAHVLNLTEDAHFSELFIENMHF